MAVMSDFLCDFRLMLIDFHNLGAVTDLSHRSSRVTMSLWLGCRSGLGGISPRRAVRMKMELPFLPSD